jgi:hypothetical protein
LPGSCGFQEFAAPEIGEHGKGNMEYLLMTHRKNDIKIEPFFLLLLISDN